MPYTHKKVGTKFVVYKKGKKVGETEGTKTALNKYLAALHIADKKTAKKEVKSLKENQQMQEANPDAPRLIQNLEFWVVEKAPAPDTDPTDMVFKSDPIHFAKQVLAGLDPADLLGFYLDENEAMDAAHDEVSSVYENAKNLEEKKMVVTGKIEETIKKLQKEVNRCMEEGNDQKAQQIIQKIAELRSKRQAVEASKKPLEEKEEE
jgi:hypothetical protein